MPQKQMSQQPDTVVLSNQLVDLLMIEVLTKQRQLD